ncbi:hypothetical protein T4D_8225 [Trichinella pseudospiralis]|uniref:Uncharacterized protein n=1 Tax=Trichinella pseudospiralis TaxID=6337 RepID=A0A0V1FS03_TRIPS|nr:hypothetical protein T4D_8225 [Trichinella pseudospiralis]
MQFTKDFRSHNIACKTCNLCLKIVRLLYSNVESQALNHSLCWQYKFVYKLFALMKSYDTFIGVHLTDSANDY